jgi:GNAT superfamily N-acetyltransferase
MNVRRARIDDLKRLLELYMDLHSTDEPLPAQPVLDKVWSDILSNPWQHVFLVEQDGQLVSSCVLQVVPNLTRGARPYGLIENVVTRKDKRGQGFGSQVLKAALDLAWEQGCYKVMLLTGRKDPEVFRFYENAGFKAGVKTGFVAMASKNSSSN